MVELLILLHRSTRWKTEKNRSSTISARSYQISLNKLRMHCKTLTIRAVGRTDSVAADDCVSAVVSLIIEYFTLGIDSVGLLSEAAKKLEATRKKQVSFLKRIVQLIGLNLQNLRELSGDMAPRVISVMSRLVESVQLFSTLVSSDVLQQMKEIWAKHCKSLQSEYSISSEEAKKMTPWPQ